MKRSLPLALLLGCTPGATPDVVVDSWELPGVPSPLDLLFVIDDSNSMATAQEDLGFAFPQLRGELDAIGVDWQIGITTTDFDDPARRGRLMPIGTGTLLTTATADPDATFAEAARVGTEGSRLERGLSTGLAAVLPPLTTQDNAGLLRDGANLAVVFVSDEDDCSDGGALAGEDPERCATSPDALLPIRELVEDFEAVLGDAGTVSLHALVEPGERPGVPSCDASAPGTRYISAAGRSGGLVLGLCGDLRPAMEDLGHELAGFRSSYPLSRFPDPTTLVVEAGGPDGAAELPEDTSAVFGWTWDEASNSVRLWGEAIPSPGDSVTISYGSATR